MKKTILFAILILIFGCQEKTQNTNKLFDAEPEVRVRIINTLSEINVALHDKWTVKIDDSSEAMSFSNGDSLKLSAVDGKITFSANGKNLATEIDHLKINGINKSSTLEIADVPYGIGWWWAGKQNRIYEGDMHIYVGMDNTLEWVVKLPLEEYLKGVVPYEIGGDSPLEALKAQAVAARSEAIIALTSGLYNGEYHDLTSDVECQVFSGNNKRTTESDLAVTETASVIISEEGKPMNAYYASNCGGHSELIENVWPDRPRMASYALAVTNDVKAAALDLSNEKVAQDWINSEPKTYCNPNLGIELPLYSQQNFRWKRAYTKKEMSEMLSTDKDLGEFKELVVKKRGVSGRMYLADFVFEKQTISVEGELSIRQMWKPALRSAAFYIEENDDSYTLIGAGWGHGVGMCQSGAVSMAKQGKEYSEILQHYYAKADLLDIY
ncbi:SpoIID/LytB domain-containing protein [Sediminitomix flava]|uniref:SpoIID/LytB domain protein n=1 Tax=Sediminitomix flava TaxID=379075 RepID=A0A315ZBW8_SEDFL|nr:SpoIID/LytB domain-containing protein [Sediminitomix flava]PWJ42860.1 SpoIID/LytB domain protein [Sediminitomix flava]